MNAFAGKTILVTGATNGIGETVAETLFARGANVVLGARTKESLDAMTKRLDPSGARALSCVTDVRDASSVKRLVDAAVERFGALHGAVNNAGIPGSAGVPIQDVDLGEWNDVLATDVSGVFYGMKYEVPAILRSGEGGAIVNMSSGNGTVGVAGLAPYTAAKHAVIGLTRAVALELAAKGVRVNAVAPGYVETPSLVSAPPDMKKAFADAHPMKRMARREEVARLVAFLLGDESTFCTGGVYAVDGGYTAQ